MRRKNTTPTATLTEKLDQTQFTIEDADPAYFASQKEKPFLKKEQEGLFSFIELDKSLLERRMIPGTMLPPEGMLLAGCLGSGKGLREGMRLVSVDGRYEGTYASGALLGFFKGNYLVIRLPEGDVSDVPRRFDMFLDDKLYH